MRQGLSIAVLSMLYCSASIFMYGQACSPADTNYIGNAYVYRVGETVSSYIQAYATGGDAAYSTITVTLINSLNGMPIGLKPTNTLPYPQFVRASQNFSIAQQGYGQYQAVGFVQAYDSCTGRSYPPYDFGNINGYTGIATLEVDQPVATFSGTAQSPMGIYASAYPVNNPNGSVPIYHTTGALSADTKGATGTPSWTITGRTSGVDLSCTDCQFPQLTTNSNAASLAQCAPTVHAYYTVDGLTSNTVDISILSVVSVDGTGPNNLHVENNSILPNLGYSSVWYFQAIDSCSNPMPFTAGHEEFPNSFTYNPSISPAPNWNFPQPNTWWNGPEGGYSDTIGFYTNYVYACPAVPTPLTPQPQLTNIEIFSGLQNIYVDPIVVQTDTQVHYLDHGGYR